MQILDTNPQLFFHLQQQRLIELIRNGKVEEALEFAQEELAPRGEENVLYVSFSFHLSYTVSYERSTKFIKCLSTSTVRMSYEHLTMNFPSPPPVSEITFVLLSAKLLGRVGENSCFTCFWRCFQLSRARPSGHLSAPEDSKWS